MRVGRGKDDRPNLMGALSIPTTLYEADAFASFTDALRSGNLKLHWREYTGYSKIRDDIKQVLGVLTKYAPFVKFNVINYNYSLLKSRRSEFDLAEIQKVVYTKLPERIFYGLLRNYGKDVYIDADVYIENANEYESIALHEKVQELLNVQSLYRGEQFIIRSSSLVPKGQEIGVEITDLLLGIVRHMITNAVPKTPSKSLLEKNRLTLSLLQDEKLLHFLCRIKYYEWNNTNELKEVNFEDYVQSFLTTNAHEFF